MCGIAALFSLIPKPDLNSIKAMTDLVRHRGPDDEGYVLFPSPDANPIIFGGDDTAKQVKASQWPYCPNENIHIDRKDPLCIALGHRRLTILDLTAAGHQPMCTSDKKIWITYNGEIYNFIEI